MKRNIIIGLLFIAATAFTVVAKNVWTNDPPHSQLGFTVTHLGINDIAGAFTDFTVKVENEKADFSDAVFTLTAKTNSINTHVEARDNHLKSADFFDAAKYPEVKFVSTSIKKKGKNKFKLTGDLTMHGVTKSVTMDLKYTGTTENPMSKKQTVGFQVTGKIKRSDFNIGAGFPPPMISDEVRIKADGEFFQ